MPTRRPVKDRLRSLSKPPPKPDGTLAMADILIGTTANLANGEKTKCTVDRYCRTRVFDFPRAKATQAVADFTIHQSASVRASLVCDLPAYFRRSHSAHYAVSPSLRHAVAEQAKQPQSGEDAIRPYVVVEEFQSFPPFALDQGCALIDEVGYEDGERKPVILGGRDDERFIVAYETSDGPWPDIPRNEQTVNLIMAAVRACQDATGEIAKHVDQRCLITDDGRFVCPAAAGTFSARAGVASPLDAPAFGRTAARLTKTIAAMHADLATEHIELLVNALYWDDYKDDEFRRLHYLSLWQSLSESRKLLGYAPPDPKTKLGNDPTVVAGSLSLEALTDYRDNIAHWWTGTIEGNCLADLYRTVNQLIRRKYG